MLREDLHLLRVEGLLLALLLLLQAVVNTLFTVGSVLLEHDDWLGEVLFADILHHTLEAAQVLLALVLQLLSEQVVRVGNWLLVRVAHSPWIKGLG